ncbi:MAG: glutamyl-tRNA reductase [Bacteroidota bacterium]
MTFGVIGISHWKSDLSIREQVSLNSIKQQELIRQLAPEVGGVIVLNTCNRIEVYACCDPKELIPEFCKISGITPELFRSFGYSYRNDDAIHHLYKVGLGLDSQILGDVQIIQQLKKAYHRSKSVHFTGTFHDLIHSVFRAHKRTRTETSFGTGAASVGYAATQIVSNTFKDLSRVRVLLIGAGKMGQNSCSNLISNGVEYITVINRTYNRALALANRFNIKALEIEHFSEELTKADVIVTATGSEQPIIKASELKQLPYKKRLILDLSVPRNVDRDVQQVDGVHLVDMDSIAQANHEAIQNRKQLIPQVATILEEEKAGFLRKVQRKEAIVPTITHIHTHLDSIAESELDRLKNQLDEEAFLKLQEFAHRLKKKVLAIHIDQLEEGLLPS